MDDIHHVMDYSLKGFVLWIAYGTQREADMECEKGEGAYASCMVNRKWSLFWKRRKVAESEVKDVGAEVIE